MRYLLILFLLVGCSESNNNYSNTGFIDITYLSHYKNFIEEANKRGLDYSNISVEIVNNENLDIPATCFFKIRRIEINPQTILYYETLFEGYIELVIFHELGHCILNLNHDGEGIMRGNFPIWFLIHYLDNRETLLDELFKRKIIDK